MDDWSYPMYFENIMMPQAFLSSRGPVPEIPDVSRYMHDNDPWANSLDFSNPSIFNFDAITTPLVDTSTNMLDWIDSPGSAVSQSSLRARFDAFRRSPWYVERRFPQEC